MKRPWAVLPHACIVLSLMFLVFLVLDDYNPMMNFIGNPISIALLAALCGLSILNSAVSIAGQRGKGS